MCVLCLPGLPEGPGGVHRGCPREEASAGAVQQAGLQRLQPLHQGYQRLPAGPPARLPIMQPASESTRRSVSSQSD